MWEVGWQSDDGRKHPLKKFEHLDEAENYASEKNWTTNNGKHPLYVVNEDNTSGVYPM